PTAFRQNAKEPPPVGRTHRAIEGWKDPVCGTAFTLDAPQAATPLNIRREGDPLTVRRKVQMGRARGLGEQADVRSVEIPPPDPAPVASASRKGHELAVRRRPRPRARAL